MPTAHSSHVTLPHESLTRTPLNHTRIAQWAHQGDAISQSTTAALEAELSNLLAVMTGGSHTTDHQELLAAWGSHPGSCTLFGSWQRADLHSAAWLNTVAAVCTERDAGHRLAQGHPAALVFPALLALAELQEVEPSTPGLHTDDTETIARALMVGYEVAARVGRQLVLGSDQHTHAILGAPGVAAGAAVILGLDAAGIARAICIALSSVAASSWEQAITGSPMRDHWAGQGAVAGLVAARVAASGRPVLAGGPPPSVGKLEPSELLAPSAAPENALMLGQGYFKRHSSCAYTHAPVDASASLRNQHPQLTPEDIAEVVVHTVEPGASLGATQWRSRHGAFFSVPFAVASMLVCGDVAYQRTDPEFLRTPRGQLLQAIAHRVRVDTFTDSASAPQTTSAAVASTSAPPSPAPQPPLEQPPLKRRPAKVTVRTWDGRELSAAVDHSFGDCELTPFTATERDELIIDALRAGAPLGRASLTITPDDIHHWSTSLITGQQTVTDLMGALSATIRTERTHR